MVSKGFPYFQRDYAGFLPVEDSKKIEEKNNFTRNYKVLNLNTKDGYEPFLIIITTNLMSFNNRRRKR